MFRNYSIVPKVQSVLFNTLRKRTEYTLALLKPDLCADPYAIKAVIEDIEKSEKPIRIYAHKKLYWDQQDAELFYSQHAGKFFYERLVGYMISGPFEAFVLEGDSVITRWRELIGQTHPVRAKVNPKYSLRSRFGLTDTRNSFHGSDSQENAFSEINLLFPELLLK
ncbi:hypothetical protein BB559_001648 [Furculomyces boomerangus]|uniref:Nucleoside diphosphate kinase n=2 Tax=Harpellales TaxID=61421 RepID=A0A2T9Z189_9FUNG|nr:hypothetical protein BB559_001648 [Furculomyces boomerangus]PVZ98901.1 hypothetical protein BB558_005104 [Smittium angustum]